MQAFSRCAIRLSIIGCKHSGNIPTADWRRIRSVLSGCERQVADSPYSRRSRGRSSGRRQAQADAVDPGRHLSTRGTARPSTRGGSGARHGSNSAPRRSRVLSGNSGLDDSNSPNTGIIEFAIRPERRSVRRAAQSFKTPPALPIVPTSRIDLGIAQLLDDLAHANSYSTRTVHSEAL